MAKKAEAETRTPLIVGGKVAVDPERCPTLHRSLTVMIARAREHWIKVGELRAAGDHDAADRAARKAMGIKSEPMSEEAKEKLREYRETHAEEIKERAKLKRATAARTRAIMVAPSGRMRRKV